jgi:hypothetical protein
MQFLADRNIAIHFVPIKPGLSIKIPGLEPVQPLRL